MQYIEAGASHVIVTSYLFTDGELNRERLQSLVSGWGQSRDLCDTRQGHALAGVGVGPL